MDLDILLFIFLGILIMSLLNLAVVGFGTLDQKDLDRQCKNLGYDYYLHHGWTGDFCVGKSESIQVINNNGKLSPIKK